GDFNFHVDNPEDRSAKELCDTLRNFNLTQNVKQPTHKQGHILDLIITKGLNISQVNVTDVALSDHFSVTFECIITSDSFSQRDIVRKRTFKDNATENFIQAYFATSTLGCNSVVELVDNFHSKVSDIIDCIAPVKVKVLSGKKKSPWRNAPAVRSEKRECRKAERRWRKNRLLVHYDIYKERLNRYNLQLKNARESFFSEIIKKNINNARVLFSTVDRLTNPPVSVASELHSTRACNEFANFFTEKILKIRGSVCTSTPALEPKPYSAGTTSDKMSQFSQINHKSLEQIIQQLSSSSCCLDVLPTAFFKKVLPVIASDLTQIINTSLLSGVFPQSLKTAIIKPLLKKNNLDKLLLQNYRPISNLPFISKIIEKAVFQQLNTFLTTTSRFDVFQSGFRAHHSTETALIKVFNDIYINTDCGRTTVLVLLDLSAAFDTVDHSILLKRLENWVGLSGTALHWFKSYLKDRDFFVSVGNFTSEMTKITCGVPQGSILGPLF
uniref:Reverse transcriptase domain-containing protein n=1 Tax=Fundulus heteroclitus TaxID=8078 RepID=A0A3Q2P679_FUNHE